MRGFGPSADEKPCQQRAEVNWDYVGERLTVLWNDPDAELRRNPGLFWCDRHFIPSSLLFFKKYKNKYAESDCTTFCLGDSKVLSKQLKEDNIKIDLFYIDGDHRRGAVLRDVLNLREHQSDKCVWIFDDYDTRFGCFQDINMLRQRNENFQIYRVGDAASGNPNHQVIICGKL